MDSDNDSELEELQGLLGSNMPVYGSPHIGYSAHELVDMIFKEDPKTKLCTEKPTSIRTFASFIIDLKSVNHKDLAAHDNGVWVTSRPRRMYELKWQRGSVQSLKHIPSNAGSGQR